MNSQSTYSDRAPGPADAPTRARIESDRAVAPQQTPIQAIPTEEFTGPTTRRWHTTRRIPLLRLFRSFAAWWADDSMNARFEQQRAHDEQLLHRHKH